jgi:hypothetical protein
MAIIICLPTKSRQRFPFLSILTVKCYLPSFLVIAILINVSHLGHHEEPRGIRLSETSQAQKDKYM